MCHTCVEKIMQMTMFFKFNCFILMIFIQQLAVRCDDLLSDCHKNPHSAASCYDKKHKEYMDFVVTVRKHKLEKINEYLQKMQMNPKCMSKYYNTYTTLDYNLLLTSVCGVLPLRHNFEAPWKTNPNATAQEICTFLEVNGAIGIKVIEYNYLVIVKCSVPQLFRDIFYKSWKDCNQCS